MKKAFTLVCLLAVISMANAQKSVERTAVNKSRYFSAGVGTSVSLGDLSNYYFFPKLNEFGSSSRGGQMLSYGVSDAYGKLGYALTFQNGGLKGFHVSDLNDTTQFQGNFSSVTYNLTVNSNTLLQLRKDPKFTVNGSVGLGVATYRSFSYNKPNAVREYDSFFGYESTLNANINGFESTELKLANKKTTIVIPIQFQLNYAINANTSVQFVLNRTSFFTDNIDAGSVVGFNKDRVLYLGLGITQGLIKSNTTGKISFSKLKNYPLWITARGGAFAINGDFAGNGNGPSSISGLKLLNGKHGSSYGLGIKKYVGENAAIALNYTLAKASGSKTLSFADTLNQAFTLDASSLSIDYSYDLNFSKENKTKLTITPFVGLGVTGFRSKSYFTQDNLLIDSYSYTEGDSFSPFAFAAGEFTKRIVIPAGVIVSIPLGEKLNIQASFNNNHYLSDALDGFVNEMSRKDRSYQISLGASFKLN
jgi:hypothetical protein